VGALFADFVARVCGANADGIAATATAVVASGRNGGLVRPAGAGHSAMPVMDSFYRAGGLAFVRPIWDHRTVVFEGARASTAAEREVGFGRSLCMVVPPCGSSSAAQSWSLATTGAFDSAPNFGSGRRSLQGEAAGHPGRHHR